MLSPSPNTTPAEGTRQPRRASWAETAGRVPSLDGVRGVAILVVMLAHFTLIAGGPIIDVAVSSLFRAGWVGVDLFFVLSGFLITGILFDSKGGEAYFRNFYARRTLRIFPLYYAVLLLTFFVVPLIWGTDGRLFAQPEAPAWSYFLYLSKFAVAFTDDIGHEILAVTWSLAIEEQFYLVWPMVVLLLGRRQLMWLCGVLVVVSLISRWILIAYGADPTVPFAVTFCRMDGLAAGAFVALLIRDEQPLGRRSTMIAWILTGAMAVAVLGILAIERKVLWQGGIGQIVGYTVVAVLFASGIFIVITQPQDRLLPRVLSQRWLTTLGKYSYALYLFHTPARAIVREYVYGVDELHSLGGSYLPGQMIFAGLSFILAFALALASWVLLEKQFLALKRFFPVAKKATTATAWEGRDVAKAEQPTQADNPVTEAASR